jgi:predicted nucleic acid-binding Zn ribbon protein
MKAMRPDAFDFELSAIRGEAVRRRQARQAEAGRPLEPQEFVTPECWRRVVRLRQRRQRNAVICTALFVVLIVYVILGAIFGWFHAEAPDFATPAQTGASLHQTHGAAGSFISFQSAAPFFSEVA